MVGGFTTLILYRFSFTALLTSVEGGIIEIGIVTNYRFYPTFEGHNIRIPFSIGDFLLPLITFDVNGKEVNWNCKKQHKFPSFNHSVCMPISFLQTSSENTSWFQCLIGWIWLNHSFLYVSQIGRFGYATKPASFPCSKIFWCKYNVDHVRCVKSLRRILWL